MKKKIVSVLLTAAMVATMAFGCGNSETASSGSAAAGDDSGEMTDIVVAQMCFSPLDASATDAVEEAINKITEEKINVHVDIQWFDATTYATQIPMMIQADEKLDVMMTTPVPGVAYSSFMAQGQLMDIADLLDEYGQDAVDAVGKLDKAFATKGGIYGLPTNRVLSNGEYVLMRKDVLDELGLTEKAENLTTWSELEEIYKAVAENTDYAPVGNGDAEGSIVNVYPFNNGSDKFADNFGYDGLGDTNYMVSVDEETDTVESVFASEDAAAAYERSNTWYNEGLVYKDAASSQEYGDSLIKNGVAFSYIGMNDGEDFLTTKSAACGTELVAAKICDGVIGTTTATKFAYAVPITATEPEAAVKYLNLLFTDSDINNTLAWGVEGRDWEEVDGVATYPDGVTADTVTYHTADFLTANALITLPWDGAGSDAREKEAASNEAAEISKYMGFCFDAANVEAEMTACFNVKKQYDNGLKAGSSDYATLYPEFIDKLEAAGMDKVIAEYQTQLDTWLAEN